MTENENTQPEVENAPAEEQKSVDIHKCHEDGTCIADYDISDVEIVEEEEGMSNDE